MDTGSREENTRKQRKRNRILYAGHVQAQMWNIPLRKGKHEGLISLATFERIQERLHGKPKIAVRVDIDEDFPLRGFVQCGDCCHPMTACWSKSKTGAKHPYYMCYWRGCESKGKAVRRADRKHFSMKWKPVHRKNATKTLLRDSSRSF